MSMNDAEVKHFLIVGLGNPGREYRDTRHNAGFMVVDRLCESFGIRLSRLQSKALIGTGAWDGRRMVLAKPQTYMNLSGQCVTSLLRFYKTPLDQLLVVHDDLDLPLGTLRLRPGGGSAGQRGLASIIQQLGTQEFPRLRVGIGRPPGQMDPADYVLERFTASDRVVIPLLLDRAVDAVKDFLQFDLSHAMNNFNGALEKE
jgi:PTH1 family peptidyl-tRNA hydrolase